MARGPGRPSKGAKVKRLIVFRPPALLARLQQTATAEGMDLSALLCRLADGYLKRRDRRRVDE
jgi:hypothetical protein